jgi:hypothetical protein
VVAAVEGGYDLQALGGSLDASIEVLSGGASEARWPSSGIASTRGQSIVTDARHVLTPYWTM